MNDRYLDEIANFKGKWLSEGELKEIKNID